LKVLNKSKTQFDVVIVGSGPAGVHAAFPLVKRGLKVAIVDAGLDSTKQDGRLRDLSSARITPQSRAYGLLQESSFVFNTTYELLKIHSQTEIIQSLAKGGLSELWHGICDFFTPAELIRIGLPADKILSEYGEVAQRIKLATGLRLDSHGRKLWALSRKNPSIKRFLYKAPRAFPYRTRSVIKYFKRFGNFIYIPNHLVSTVREKGAYIETACQLIGSGRSSTIKSKFVILAAGSINTTRIVLRSFGLYNYRTPFLTKANYLVVCLHLRTLGRPLKRSPSELGQLIMRSTGHDGNSGWFTQLYSVNPLSFYKAFSQIPLPTFLTKPFLLFVAPSLMIADIRFPSYPTGEKYSLLQKMKDGTDVLEIAFTESEEEKQSHEEEVHKIKQKLRSLGLFPIKVIHDYTTTHYASGVPMSEKRTKMSVDAEGRIHRTKRIYIADASSWRVLPAKPPAFTIMANASRVGKNVLRNFKRK